MKWQAATYSDAHSGRRVARFTPRQYSGSLELTQTIPLCPGIGYIFSFWVKRTGISTCAFNLVLNNGYVIVENDSVDWEKLEGYATSAVMDGVLKFQISCNGFPYPRLYIDDVQVRPATSADAALFP
jgi:hypothetical protein